MAADHSSKPKETADARVISGGAPGGATAEAPAPATVRATEAPAAKDSPLAAIANVVYEDVDTDTKLYRVTFLNASFAVLSMLLLVLTIWAVWQDYSREWKYFQYEWQAYQKGHYQEELAAERARIEQEKTALESQREDLRRATARDGSIPEKEYLVEQLENEARQLSTDAKFFKAEMDTAKFEHHEKIKYILFEEGGQTPQAQRRIAALEDGFNREWTLVYEHLLAIAEAKEVEATAQRESLEERRQKLADTRSQLDALQRRVNLLETNLRAVDDSAANTLRNSPLLDFFAPSAVIHKAVVADLTEPLNFVDVPRVDRCKSCHVNIDDPDPSLATVSMPDAKHGGRLFRSHPRLDLFVGSTSPHPYLEFGCTTCHYGDGHSLTFTTASHAPRNAAQAEEWETKYHWHEMHHQDFPMLPMTQISATCAKCHKQESRVPGATRWNVGRSLVEDYGCFGCHKIEGFESYRKVGPNLSRISQKVGPEFLYKWIRNPPSFRSTTRMPRFFDLPNSRGKINVIGFQSQPRVHDFDRRNGMEALAIATYLDTTARPEEALVYSVPEGLTGDVERGRVVLRESGCLGCHSVLSEEDPAFHQNNHGPDLSPIGSKVSPEWLAAWIVNPPAYDPETRMPRLRIEEDEGGDQKLADLVAYLMGLRNEEFEQAAPPAIDEENRRILDDIAYDYLRTKATRSEAVEQVEAFESHEAILAYIGGRLVQRYGCFGCHEGIEGYADAQPIGTELSRHGNKNVDRLDFGFWGHQPSGRHAISHDRAAWFRAKLENTRIFDMMPQRKVDGEGHVTYVPTDERVEKLPEELLKMPLFPFHDDPEKVEAVVTFLGGLTGDPIPPQKEHKLEGLERDVEDGRRLARFLNCQGCHRIGADIQEKQIDSLPRFSFFGPPEDMQPSQLERETWLADAIVLEAIEVTLPDGTTRELPGMTFRKDTLLSQKFRYRIPELADGDDEFSVVEIIDHYWDLTGRAERDQILRVYGYDEGRVRHAFGLGEEERAMAPPLLRREGERVHGTWLFDFLLDIRPLRPWLSIRMPSYNFTPEESRTIAQMFRGLADITGPYETFAAHTMVPELASLGRQLFQSKQPGDDQLDPPPSRLACDSCHPARGHVPTTPRTSWGPDLAMARERLRPDWIAGWLTSPPMFMPGTKMPEFWLQRDNFLEASPLPPEDREFVIRHVPWLAGTGFDAAALGQQSWRTEIEALLQYLMHMNSMEGN